MRRVPFAAMKKGSSSADGELRISYVPRAEEDLWSVLKLGPRAEIWVKISSPSRLDKLGVKPA